METGLGIGLVLYLAQVGIDEIPILVRIEGVLMVLHYLLDHHLDVLVDRYHEVALHEGGEKLEEPGVLEDKDLFWRTSESEYFCHLVHQIHQLRVDVKKQKQKNSKKKSAAAKRKYARIYDFENNYF